MKKHGFTLIEFPVVRKRGFTLIELLVVIAIIGILALLIILNLAGAAERSRYAKAKSELKTIDDAVTIAFVEASTKPAISGNFWQNLGGTTYPLTNIQDSTGNNLIQNLPTKPADDWGVYRVYVKGASNHYAGIQTPSNGADYCVFKGGSVYTGTVATTTANPDACDPE